jgi:hypothetical protein
MGSVPFNPYIVGNPIKSGRMFFGREDDFAFVQKKIGEGRTNQIVVLCGERRSGKTSILFQILGGRLGDQFLPVLVDMQMLAGVQGDLEFFDAILRTGCASPPLAGFDAGGLPRSGSPAERVDAFLRTVETWRPGRIVLFLFDEYELIESKIGDGTLGEASIHAFSGILESPRRVSFVFTGSTNLEDREGNVWKSLLAKSIYRKISYLSRRDTMRLITEPLGGSVVWPPEVPEAIYRLTGGQPFYTQVICQNMVDLLIEEGRDNPSSEDLERVVREIVDNPLPQMIYSWNAIAQEEQVVLSSLAGVLEEPEGLAGGPAVQGFTTANRIVLPFPRERINVLLDAAFHREMLEKEGDSNYRFRMDIFRQWIRREHSIWKIAREAGLSFHRRARPQVAALIVVVGLLVIILAAGLSPWPRFVADARRRLLTGPGPTTQPADRTQTPSPVIEKVIFRANRGPFDLTIDGQQTYTSRGQKEADSIVVQSMSPGTHGIVATPLPGAPITREVDIAVSGQLVELVFGPRPAAPAETVAAGTTVPAEAPPVPQPAAAEPPETSSGETRPAAPVAQAEKTGMVVISTRPPDARVFVDGVDTGRRTPFTESMKAGTYRLGLELTGYRTFSATIEVVSDKPLEKDITLEQAWGQLTLDVRPTAKIYLDGVFLVETPYAKPLRVRAGPHVLRIENEDLQVSREMNIDIAADETRLVQEVLKEAKQ